MRIAFVTPEFITEPDNFDGGLSNYLARVTLALAEYGHEVIVIVSSFENSVLNFNDVEVHRLLLPKIKPVSARWIEQSVLFHFYIESLSKEKPIDIIQYASYTGTGFFRSFSIPSVVRISSLQKLWNEKYGKEISEEIEKQTLIEQTAFKKADGIYGPSKLITDVLSEELKIPAVVIEPPFQNRFINYDYSVFESSKISKPYLLFYGTIGVLKGCDSIANILLEFFEKNPGYQFCFIGKEGSYGDSGMVNYIFNKAGKYKDSVFRFDKLPQDQLIPFIEHAECVVLPSRIDNFPNTCIEAMALGKIVIGTNKTGFDQLILNGHNGFLCESENPGSLLDSIEMVLNLKSDEKTVLSNNAKARIAQLSPDFKIRELIDYYKNIIEKFSRDKLSSEIRMMHQLDELLLNTINCKNEKIDQLNSKRQDQQNHINAIYSSRSYKTGNKIINLLKLNFRW